MDFTKRDDWLAMVPSDGCEGVYSHPDYIVEKYRLSVHPDLEFRLVVKRCDKQPIRDWRALQDIKNAIVGEEREALEIYPPESEVTDTGNLYHLWVLREGCTLAVALVSPTENPNQ